ncbi:PAS domain S-box protein [Maribacter sp. X9]|uniref:PAS domain-containing hybrid sensor histidine kinase/response regulator n=1 Tax=Maribacter sp. X9 TaxID=3402159 RepID=UPI003AF36293
MKHSKLKDSLNNVLINTPAIFDWVTEKTIDGLWFYEKNHPDKIWINSSFWQGLNFNLKESDYALQTLYNIYKIASQNTLNELLVDLTTNERKSTRHFISFTNKEKETLSYEVDAYEPEDQAECSYCLLRFKKNRVTSSHKGKTASEERIKTLENLIGIYEETNEIARIGGWEVDLIKNDIIWTKLTCDIHEVSEDYKPSLAEGINFYKEGWSRDLITKAIADAIEKGKPFDTELKIITAKNNELWVRAFGTPVFENGQCTRIYGAFQDIDEKKKNSIELQLTKSRFEKIFNSSPLGIVLINTKNELLSFNPASLDIFGLWDSKEEDVLKLSFKNVILPEKKEEAIDLHDKLIKGEINSYQIDAKCIHSSGKIIWCSLNSSIVRGIEHTEDFIITQIEDISEQKKLQQLAAENADKLTTTFDNSPNGMGVINLDGEWVMVNRNLLKMLGYSKQEFLKLNIKDIIHPEDHKNKTLFTNRFINKKIDYYSSEKRFLKKDGATVHCYLHVAAIHNTDRNDTTLICQIVDMSEQIKAKNDLKHSLDDLQGLLDATTQVLIIETDLNHVIKKFNKGAENLLGYDANEIIGKKSPSFFHIKEEVDTYAKELSAKYGTKIKSEEVFTHNVQQGEIEAKEWTYLRKDGSTFPVQLVITAILDQNKNIKGYLGVATDITYLKNMEQSLVASKEKAEAASKTKSEFLANMSHEIRTPLNAVIGFTDLLMKTDLSDSQQSYMDTVNSSAISLLDLINDVLDFSKIEAGKLELYEEKVDLIKLCGQTIDLIKQQAHSKNLEVLLNVSPEINRFIHADTVRLRQVLINLLSNAVKFTDKGEIELKVAVRKPHRKSEKMCYIFSIRDTGIGIAKENIDKIFFAFDQEDGSTTRKYGGSGLGLTISNSLLNLMGSNLMVKSKSGSGSVFYFEVFFKTHIEEFQDEIYSGHVKRVLIVDDNENNRTTLKKMLDIDKINSKLLANGVDAIDILQEGETFDLAIIDYHMPYMNGLDVIKHIRQELKINREQLPILLLHSSGEDEKILKKCKELDIQFNMVKPIKLNALFDLIAKVKRPGSSIYEKAAQVETLDVSLYNYKIMVAEDNPVNKYLVKTIITKLLPKAEILEVDNGQEAVDLYKTTPLDLILMDIQMPVLSGFEASQKIRTLENSEKRVPIIAVTAKTVKGIQENCLEFGMDDYVTKPLVLETLKNVFVKYLTSKDHKSVGISTASD